TAGLAPGFVQANLAILPRDAAYDFLLFCQRNPRPCPLIEVTDAGSPEPVGVAPGADLRTDLPRYRIYKDGVMADEVTDITPFWRDDLVAFLLGCSFPFEWARAPRPATSTWARTWRCGRRQCSAAPPGVFTGPWSCRCAPSRRRWCRRRGRPPRASPTRPARRGGGAIPRGRAQRRG